MSGVPPKKGVAFSFLIPVFASDGSYKTGVTFSATQISKDNGTYTSLSNAPVEVGTSGTYLISLTASEMNADNIVIRLVPSTALTQAAGAEIFTDSAQIGELVRSTTPANTLDVSATGEAGLDFNNIKDATGAHTLTNIRVPNVTLADTATNLTNAPANGDFTATMKTSLNNATPSVTVSDKTGFSLSVAGILAIWNQLKTDAGLIANSLGKLLADNIDATISSRTKPADTQAAVTLVATTTNLTNAPTVGDFTAVMKTSLNNATPSTNLSKILGTAITESVPGQDADAFTKFFNVAVPTGTVNALPTNIPGGTGGLPLFEDILTADDTRAALGLVAPNLDNQFTNLSLIIQDVPGEVWDEDLSQHLNAGSTGLALNNAASGGSDPWATDLPNGYAPGEAGFILGNLSAAIFPAGAIEVTFTVLNSVTSLPIDGARVWISTDLAGTNTIWAGTTNAFGVAINVNNEKPFLNAGTYYAWIQDSGYTDTNPTTLNVS